MLTVEALPTRNGTRSEGGGRKEGFGGSGRAAAEEVNAVLEQGKRGARRRAREQRSRWKRGAGAVQGMGGRGEI